MSPAHTPGPWEAVPPDGGAPTAKDLWELAQRHGLQSDYWFIRGPGDDVHGHMSEADARLIAAAPELLEALDAILNALPSATTHPAIKMARAAMAKATGDQP